jgi:hypothetical protein
MWLDLDMVITSAVLPQSHPNLRLPCSIELLRRKSDFATGSVAGRNLDVQARDMKVPA